MAYPASVGRPVTDRAAALHIGHMLSRVALTGTIVRLGEALPVVFFSSAVDFILPVNCRRSTTAVRAASGTAGKMNSPEAEPRHAEKKERKKTDNPREGWEDGTPPPHRDFKERCVMR